MSTTKSGIVLTYGPNDKREPGRVHEELHAPCGCAFHERPAPHWHPCAHHAAPEPAKVPRPLTEQERGIFKAALHASVTEHPAPRGQAPADSSGQDTTIIGIMESTPKGMLSCRNVPIPGLPKCDCTDKCAFDGMRVEATTLPAPAEASSVSEPLSATGCGTDKQNAVAAAPAAAPTGAEPVAWGWIEDGILINTTKVADAAEEWRRQGRNVVPLYSAPPPAAAPQGWRPISEAPKDGTEILIWRDGWDVVPLAKWGENDGEDGPFFGWVLRDGVYPGGGVEDGFLGWNEDIEDGQMPTHFMPLPEPPK